MFYDDIISGGKQNNYSFPSLLTANKDSLESLLIEARALEHGFNTFRLGAAYFYAYKDDKENSFGFVSTASSFTSKPAVSACVNKMLTKRLLKDSGLPVAAGRRFRKKDTDLICKYFEKYIKRGVLKPLNGKGGEGVYVDIQDQSYLKECLSKIQDKNILLEKFIEGLDYRFSVVGDKVSSVAVRVPAHVVGDGISNIEELVVNKNKLRKNNPHLCTRLIKLDEKSNLFLERQGVSFSSVPESGSVIYLNNAANLSAGGDSIDVTDETHPDLKMIAVKSVKSIPGLLGAGVDILIENHQLSASEQDVAICEMNSSPGFSMHHFPVYGVPKYSSFDLFDTAARKAGYVLNEIQGDKINIHFEIKCMNTNYYKKIVEQKAEDLSLNCEMRTKSNSIFGKVEANPLIVSSFLSCVADGISSGKVHFIKTFQV